MAVMQKGPKYLLCENLQTNPEVFFVMFNRAPFILYEFNENLDVVSVKYLGNEPNDKRKLVIKNAVKHWLKQYVKDNLSNK